MCLNMLVDDCTVCHAVSFCLSATLSLKLPLLALRCRQVQYPLFLVVFLGWRPHWSEFPKRPLNRGSQWATWLSHSENFHVSSTLLKRFRHFPTYSIKLFVVKCCKLPLFGHVCRRHDMLPEKYYKEQLMVVVAEEDRINHA